METASLVASRWSEVASRDETQADSICSRRIVCVIVDV
jgi:hypothetical protein